MSLIFLFGGDLLSKINPGSNFNEDNDVRTARPVVVVTAQVIEVLKWTTNVSYIAHYAMEFLVQEKITSATLYLSISPPS